MSYISFRLALSEEASLLQNRFWFALIFTLVMRCTVVSSKTAISPVRNPNRQRIHVCNSCCVNPPLWTT